MQQEALKEGTLIQNKYKIIKKVGKGAYGAVYKALDLENNEVIALKQMFVFAELQGIHHSTLREISILQNFKHEYIVNLQDVIVEQKQQSYIIYLKFQFLDQDLQEYLSNTKFDLDETKVFLYEILLALNYCHYHGIFHRDLKPSNIMVDMQKSNELRLLSKGYKVCLSDFGLARPVNIPINPMTKEIQTICYKAPELLLGVDKYSLGVDI